LGAAPQATMCAHRAGESRGSREANDLRRAGPWVSGRYGCSPDTRVRGTKRSASCFAHRRRLIVRFSRSRTRRATTAFGPARRHIWTPRPDRWGVTVSTA
jgi:hypothetical protein